MLYIQVIDKDRFMHQVKASQGGVFLHLERPARAGCSCIWRTAPSAT